MVKPKVCVLQSDGTNCDKETAFAFSLVGGDADIIHINSLIKGYDPVSRKVKRLEDYQILAIPGGFSHGDYLTAGKVFAELLKNFLGEQLEQFVKDGKLVIGICNGFQVLAKYGLLPMADGEVKQTATLTYNDSHRFEDRWVHLIAPRGNGSICAWTKGISSIDLPVAHGEGKFMTDGETYELLVKQHQIVFQYANAEGLPVLPKDYPSNPNGSFASIAGICDPTGRVFGIMPHPERYREPGNHALWTLQKILSMPYINKEDSFIQKRLDQAGELPTEGKGLKILRNGIDYVVNNLR